MIGDTNCVDEVVIGAITHNPTTKTREFPFRAVEHAPVGHTCEVIFNYKRPWEPMPHDINGVKKIIFTIV